ncbi:uncharacterized protein METZ01_LOCUS39519 [marine metagenome]|uniref:Uncharacterized protein n=1 Tax=marine metagenome TaxID=408172 RepID=A0A381R4I9_9ZZZZ
MSNCEFIIFNNFPFGLKMYVTLPGRSPKKLFGTPNKFLTFFL